MTVWIIGAGPMAQDYGKVLFALNEPFEVIGRGTASAKAFYKSIGKAVSTGGLQLALDKQPAPAAAIVAVGVDQLAEISTCLIQAGTKRILLEKPGGVDLYEIEQLSKMACLYGTEVLLAYNRRFYASTIKAQECIDEDGGLLSAQFEFTEWAHKVEPLMKGSKVKEHWMLSNSSHVLDLAFYFCGQPAEWRGWHRGTLPWHPAAARFCGAGVTTRGVLFSYHADWQAPGRWGVELLTRKRRLILRPLEQLQFTMLGTIDSTSMELYDSLDLDFKPGIYRQTAAFLAGESQSFCTLAQQVQNIKIYSEMGGYL